MTSSPNIRSKQRFSNFVKALHLYEEAVLQRAKLSRLEEEGLIQRFEYSFELAWKCLQDLLQERGYPNVRGPKPVLEQAFQDGIISDGLVWMEMLKARNETSHLYDQATFESIALKVKTKFLPVLKNFEAQFPK